ncbi:MAG TPA: site-specific DNA-methyltransferase [Verrucomicrobiae bacterium]
MQKLTVNDPETKSPDLVAENLAALKALFPELLTEGPEGVAVNLDVMKQLVGDRTVTEAEEKYGLNWHGKRRARQLALTPSTGTLRPCPEDSVDWDTTQNLMIEGDNLEVLKLLQKSYAGKVKLIYIDPPYNTGKDFVYPDNFQDNIKNYLEITGQTGEGGQKLSSNTEASGRFHTDWLNMMYPRLKLARNLLRDDGVIFISIDDNEIDNLQKLCSEILGEENFLGCITWQKKYAPANDTIDFSPSHDYLLVYAKLRPTGQNGKLEAILSREERSEKTNAAYKNPDNDPRGLWRADNYKCNKTSEERPNLYYSIIQPNTGDVIWPNKSAVWRYSKEKHEQNCKDKRVWWGVDGTNLVPAYKRFLSDVEGVVAQTIWLWSETGHNDEAKKEIQTLFPDAPDIFQTPKPTRLISKILSLGTIPDEENIVLDFFGGSATTAHAVLNQNLLDNGNRKYILVQLPEPTERKDYPTIAHITRERLRRAGKKIKDENSLFAGDLGFRVFKLDSTNIREWDPNRANLAESLEASVEHLKTNRTEQDILFELLLKLGLDLCVPIETRKIGTHEVHSIGAGTLLVCLSKSIPQAEVEPLALGLVAWHKELKPAGETTVVFRDSAFANDVAKTNLAAILQQYGLGNVRSL